MRYTKSRIIQFGVVYVSKVEIIYAINFRYELKSNATELYKLGALVILLLIK